MASWILFNNMVVVTPGGSFTENQILKTFGSLRGLFAIEQINVLVMRISIELEGFAISLRSERTPQKKQLKMGKHLVDVGIEGDGQINVDNHDSVKIRSVGEVDTKIVNDGNLNDVANADLAVAKLDGAAGANVGHGLDTEVTKKLSTEGEGNGSVGTGTDDKLNSGVDINVEKELRGSVGGQDGVETAGEMQNTHGFIIVSVDQLKKWGKYFELRINNHQQTDVGNATDGKLNGDNHELISSDTDVRKSLSTGVDGQISAGSPGDGQLNGENNEAFGANIEATKSVTTGSDGRVGVGNGSDGTGTDDKLNSGVDINVEKELRGSVGGQDGVETAGEKQNAHGFIIVSVDQLKKWGKYFELGINNHQQTDVGTGTDGKLDGDNHELIGSGTEVRKSLSTGVDGQSAVSPGDGQLNGANNEAFGANIEATKGVTTGSDGKVGNTSENPPNALLKNDNIIKNLIKNSKSSKITKTFFRKFFERKFFSLHDIIFQRQKFVFLAIIPPMNNITRKATINVKDEPIEKQNLLRTAFIELTAIEVNQSDSPKATLTTIKTNALGNFVGAAKPTKVLTEITEIYWSDVSNSTEKFVNFYLILGCTFKFDLTVIMKNYI
ncbi:hypothetical protein Bhyg_14032 [Pseudolycoriella hygida]|uniref:Uncharacterized protein n=1 Tax=Pseudolycoriella hygida TaxID=35572 RepID=A0A9Q0MPH4_9DIPT|nr:hypothetical protein Bhyg_14032 [Pseudolycoriella hygida]